MSYGRTIENSFNSSTTYYDIRDSKSVNQNDVQGTPCDLVAPQGMGLEKRTPTNLTHGVFYGVKLLI